MTTSIERTVSMEEQGLLDDAFGLGYVGRYSVNTYCITGYIPDADATFMIDDWYMDGVFQDIHGLVNDDYPCPVIVADWVTGCDWSGWEEEASPRAYEKHDARVFLAALRRVYHQDRGRGEFPLDRAVWMPLLCSFIDRQIQHSSGIFIYQA